MVCFIPMALIDFALFGVIKYSDSCRVNTIGSK